MSKRQASASSTSMRSANSKMLKIHRTKSLREGSPTVSAQPEAEVVLRPSPLKTTDESRLEWQNDIHLQVSRNLFHLRRARRVSQEVLAKAIGTSQPAIARIESGEENITLGTMKKWVTQLRGRFYIATPPEELKFDRPESWWKSSAKATNTAGWAITDASYRRRPDGEDVRLQVSRNRPRTPLESTVEAILISDGDAK
jgi:transcriptional regulator with XRE-family HTH domain